MVELNWKDRISIKPDVCHGRPCIKGTRIWVSLVLDFLAGGATVDEIMREYPQLGREDVLACIAYGAEDEVNVAARLRFLGDGFGVGLGSSGTGEDPVLLSDSTHRMIHSVNSLGKQK